MSKFSGVKPPGQPRTGRKLAEKGSDAGKRATGLRTDIDHPVDNVKTAMANHVLAPRPTVPKPTGGF